MKKYGLEQEFFLIDQLTGKPVIPEDLKVGLPIDSCGYLVEARGKAYYDIIEAVYSLLAEVERIKFMLLGTQYVLDNTPVLKLSKLFLFKVSRKYVKGLTKYENYYDFINHKLKTNERTAGLHISITDERSLFIRGKTHYYYQNFDWISIFRKFDHEFSEEIKGSQRRPGFYEIKEDGRIEYRSLPSNINFNKLITICKNL